MPAPRLLARSRLDPKTYHPTLNAAVEEAYGNNIDLLVFPALVRLDKLADVQKWLRDASDVRRQACTSCAKAGRDCILHNGNSLRCLYCYLTDARECSHQTAMERLGHAKTPPCMKYKVAVGLNLTPVPDGFAWAGKHGQEKGLLNDVLYGESGDTTEGEGMEDEEEGDETVGEEAGNRQQGGDDVEKGEEGEEEEEEEEEEVDKLEEEEPARSKGKARAGGPSTVRQTQRMSTTTTKLTVAQVLDARLSDMHATLREILTVQKKRLAVKRNFVNMLGSDSESDREAKKTEEAPKGRAEAAEAPAVAAPTPPSISTNVSGPSRLPAREQPVAGPSRPLAREQPIAGPSRPSGSSQRN
ncbi:hypothetical protein C8T65DRAFT_700495 [Cerioporus squamosus]|nr:hypothetical protein C8T65DRAFT_700495 [Cerioporus squamosus]